MKKHWLLKISFLFSFGLSLFCLPTSCGNTNDLAYCDFFKFDLNDDETYTISTNWTHSRYKRKNFNEAVIIPSVHPIDDKPITKIGNDFLVNCYLFNNKLIIPDCITTIGDNFLKNCSSFNQTINFPDSLITIGNNFLERCESFNQPLSLPSSITSISESFLCGCLKFNKSISIPNNVILIDKEFLYKCEAFNQPLILPESLTTIGQDFMGECFAFNQNLTIPQAIKTIDTYFMYNCKNFVSTLTFNCSSDWMMAIKKQEDSNGFWATDDNNALCYQKGITISGNHDLIEVIKAYFSNRSQLPYCRKLNFQEI